MILFTVFAPVTVPAYLLFLAGSNLLGAAYYIVIEASAARIVGRPIRLSRLQIALLAPLVLAIAPVATVVHLVLWFLKSLAHVVCWIGHWQVDIKTRGWSFACGALWVLAAVWTTMICFDAAIGMGWIGRGVSDQSREQFLDCVQRGLYLGELPAEMQTRRKALIQELAEKQDVVSPDWRIIKEILEDDDVRYSQLPSLILMRKLAGIPWFFMPKEFSEDGLDHSILMLGPLVFTGMLLVRWPGTFFVLRRRPLYIVWFLVRIVAVTAAIYALAAWVPTTADDTLWRNPKQPPTLFGLSPPAAWLGVDPLQMAEPAWLLFNVGLWMMVAGLVVLVWYLAWRIGPFLGWPRYYVAFLASRLLQRKRIAFFSVGAVTLCVAMMIIVISVMGGFVDNIRQRAHSLLGDLVVDAGLQGFPFYEEFIDEISQLRDEQTDEPLVEAATPLIHAYGILQFPRAGITQAVQVWGVRLDEYVRVNDFGKDLFYQNRFGGTRLDTPMGQPVYGMDDAGNVMLPGDMDKHYRAFLDALPEEERIEHERKHPRDGMYFFTGPGIFDVSSDQSMKPGYEGKPRHGLIMGRDVVFRNRPSGEYRRRSEIPRGEICLLTVLPLNRDGSVPLESPPKPAFRYVDDSKTGIHEIDSRNVYVDFDRLQELLAMGPQERADGTGMTSPRCGQIQIKLRGDVGFQPKLLREKQKRIEAAWLKVASEVNADGIEESMLNNVGIQTWEEMQGSYIAAIEKEKFLVLIMFGVISIVAVFLILCIFYMIVQEKVRDIGIIKSVGASTEGIVAVFLVYAGAIGLVGCLLGSLLGTSFVDHINEIQDWLARINPAWRVWSPESYSFDKIPSEWKWSEVLWIGVLAVIASIAGAAIPAVRAGRTWPVESLRTE